MSGLSKVKGLGPAISALLLAAEMAGGFQQAEQAIAQNLGVGWLASLVLILALAVIALLWFFGFQELDRWNQRRMAKAGRDWKDCITEMQLVVEPFRAVLCGGKGLHEWFCAAIKENQQVEYGVKMYASKWQGNFACLAFLHLVSSDEAKKNLTTKDARLASDHFMRFINDCAQLAMWFDDLFRKGAIGAGSEDAEMRHRVVQSTMGQWHPKLQEIQAKVGTFAATSAIAHASGR